MPWKDWPSIEVGPDRAAAVATAAGADPHDPASCVYSGGRLHVRNATQEDLAAALAAYDPLPVLREQALEEIDRRAGEARAPYLTDIPGQALVYEAKRREAVAWIAAGEPTDPKDVDFPIAAAEALACGRTLAEQLKVYAAEAAAWQVLAGTMEATRMAAKQAVLAATDVAAIQAILDGLSWQKA